MDIKICPGVWFTAACAFFGLSLHLVSLPAVAEDSGNPAPPNFVVFLVDDLGYTDIGANNPETFYETPNIDRLAAGGLRFTNGYAANPVCSPTRYSLMTGKYPSRVDATNYFSGKRAERFRPAPLANSMPLEEVTLAEALKLKGYKTAFLGKWHLGPTEQFWPEAQGFDINIGGHDRGSPPGGYFSPYKNPRLESGPEGEYLTHRLTDEAVNLLDQIQDGPFLLYLSFYSVHTPLQAPVELVQKYKTKADALPDEPEFGPEEQVWPNGKPRNVRIRQQHPTYAAMVETMDRAVGRVLDRLERLNVADNTVVIFTSDNGGLSTSEGSPTSNLPLRGGKGWVYEGGIREPFLIRWPEKIAAGRVSDEVVCSIDLYPTVLEIAGVSSPQSRLVDGVSWVPHLLDDQPLPARPLFWHYPHYSNQGGFPGGAIRFGDWKLIERYEDGSTQLYHLRNDVGETSDLSGRHPQLASELRSQLHEWYNTVDAKFLQQKADGPEPWHP